ARARPAVARWRRGATPGPRPACVGTLRLRVSRGLPSAQLGGDPEAYRAPMGVESSAAELRALGHDLVGGAGEHVQSRTESVAARPARLAGQPIDVGIGAEIVGPGKREG